MANKKFSEFELKTTTSNVSHVVGYDGTENVRITPANFLDTTGGPYLPLAGGNMTGNTTHNDNVRAQFGASNDLQIYHDSNVSYVRDDGTGGFFFTTNGDAMHFQDNTGEYMAKFVKDGATELYYDSVKKFETTSLGATVTGDLLVTGTITGVGGSYLPLAGGTMTGTNGVVFPDNFYLNLGTSSDFEIYHDGNNSYLKDQGTGELILASNGTGIKLEKTSGEKMIHALTDGAVELYFDSVKKFETTTTGVTITSEAVVGNGTNGLQFSHSTSNSSGIINTGFSSTAVEIRTGNVQRMLINSTESTFAGQVVINSNSGLSLKNADNTNEFRLFNSGATGGSGGILTFNAVNVGERMRLDASGNLGLGNSSPQAKLDVSGNVVIDDGVGRITLESVSGENKIISTTTGFGAYEKLTFAADDYEFKLGNSTFAGNVTVGSNFLVSSAATEYAYVNFGATTGYGWQVGKAPDTGGIVDDQGFYLYNLNTGYTGVNLAVLKSGNVGVGTSTPSYPLVVSNGGASGFEFIPNALAGVNELQIYNRSTSVLETLRLNSLDLQVFTGGSERMRITSAGDTLFGKTSNSFTDVGISLAVAAQITVTRNIGAPMALNKLGGNGDILQFYKDTAQVGSVSVTASATAYNTSSDYRLKEDLQDFKGLDLVSKIPVYDYKWKAEDSRSYGVMAHELAEVLPQAVSGDKDAEEMQSVDYSKIVPLLVKSIQELSAKLESLECQCKKK